MKLIKLIIYKVFGLKTYLKIVSKTYISIIKLGIWKSRFPEMYFLQKIVKQGDTCIDIGANLGYYSVFMSKYAGAKGQVFAVEPVPLFAQIWKINTRKCNNITLFPYALGEQEAHVKMGMPFLDGGLHHGMTKILTDEKSDYERVFTVEMRIPSVLFSNLDKIDFIKVDIEGYESIVFNNMKDIIAKHKPFIQSELGGEQNRKTTISLLRSLNYTVKILKNQTLIEITDDEILKHDGDFYFVNEK